MNEYKVWQKAEVWYLARVDADDPEEALAKAREGDSNYGWELEPETATMLYTFEVYDEEFNLLLEKDDN
jgi:hypothetical protein